jgi:hypothetical protein
LEGTAFTAGNLDHRAFDDGRDFFLHYTGSLSSQLPLEVGKHGSSGPGGCGLPKAKWLRKQQILLLKTAS